MTLVGHSAPDFTATAVLHDKQVVHDFSLSKYLGEKAVVLFFYPKDFTFVCPTELWAFQKHQQAFEARGAVVVGCSTDTAETHSAWLRTPAQEGGIQGVTYPLIADEDKTIASRFGVLGGRWSWDEQGQLVFEGPHPVAYRATFLIDTHGIVRHASVNDLPLGRNVAEVLRTLDMWQHVEKHGQVCPAGWQEGAAAMEPTAEGVASYMRTHHDHHA